MIICDYCFDNDADAIIIIENGEEKDCCENCLVKAVEKEKGVIYKIIKYTETETETETVK